MTIRIVLSLAENESVFAILQGSQLKACAASSTVALETGNSTSVISTSGTEVARITPLANKLY